MQRFLNNLLAAAVIGLVSTSASLVMAHGGGGGGHGGGGHGGGGHSGGHSGGGRSMGHSGGSHSSSSRSFHPRTSGNSKGNKPTHLARLAGNGNPPGTIGHNPPGHHPGHPGHPRFPRHRWPYHMHYPVGFWFSGDYDVVDGDVVDGGIDVQFTKICQLDAGDASKNLAPAYRVWFHNNSDVDINQPFDVAILASTDGQLAQSLPYASIRVDGIAADDTMSVDIRLPAEAMSMASSDGQAASFAYVHSIIDSQKELVETNKANNLSVDGRDTIPAAAADAE